MRGLGLRKIHQVVEREDTPMVRGMISRVSAPRRGGGVTERPWHFDDLKPARGSVRERKRVGRGPGSGLGKTSGRGEKGQKSRSGYARKPGFEGGQMPLHRRVPKRGLPQPASGRSTRRSTSGAWRSSRPAPSSPRRSLQKRGLCARSLDGVKILAKGDLTKALTVRAHKFSAKAQERITGLGGKAEVLEK